ncbi:SemiSWEET transporter [Oceanirhabdus seepicola]|uniref:SemiSWEET family sugar transporter n=1 Tax=Oceanirhabdus seepicola TaxID=2828781 RepID=A0A9J6NVB8_9CLOT|nr:SemiSWEET transporter [Oceanirhabdus seepicola]MCM1988431.1 SemiSWEET family sugar transporter [Oceanirhabdus seepicola]
MIEYVGLLAALLTTVSFLPQAIKVIKEKNTTGISLGMYSMFTVGVFLWLIYGISRSDFPVIIANATTFVFAGTILTMKIKYK